MKKLLSVLLIVSSAIVGCTKDCHSVVHLKNESENGVMFGLIFGYGKGLYIIDGELLERDSIKDWQPFRTCIEKNIGDGLEFLILDSAGFQEQVACSWDSLDLKYKILKRYKLTIGDLQRTDFTIVYR
ncbi:MAG: hypothetical protein KF744_16565 [Taibaiella sp.]|nr:hypothetical protein [Taibaiella sp.]